MTDRVGEVPGDGLRFSSIQVIAAAVGIVIVAFIVLLASGDVVSNDPQTGIVGENVSQFAATSYDGQSFDMDSVLAQNRVLPADEQVWTVVNFFASWCTPWIEENPELIRFDTEGAACPTRLVGVTMTDTAENVADFFDRYGGGWPVLVGDTAGIIVDFSVLAPPETVIVAPSGVITQKFIGAVDYDALVGAIQC